MRTLTKDERQVVLALGAEFQSDEERVQLSADLDHCSVTETVQDGSILAFDIAGYQRPTEHGRWHYLAKSGAPVRGLVKDADGAEMEVILLGDTNHRIREFEIIKYHPGSVIKPDWRTFKVK